MPQTYYTATPDPDARLQCRHIFPDGHRCGSPCLRTQQFCYYHHTTRRPIADTAARLARTSTFTLPSPADLVDRSGIQIAIAEVLHRIAANDIDPRRGGLLLYGLQVASLNLPKPSPHSEPTQLVDEITEDPILGTLAPPTIITTLEPRRPLQVILEKLDREEKEQAQQPEDPHPGTLPEVQASAQPTVQSTPNPNLLRSLPANRRRGHRLKIPSSPLPQPAPHYASALPFSHPHPRFKAHSKGAAA